MFRRIIKIITVTWDRNLNNIDENDKKDGDDDHDDGVDDDDDLKITIGRQ